MIEDDRTVPCQKDQRKGHTTDNYRSITCLTLIWKLLTGVIAEEMHNYLEREKSSSRRTKMMQKTKSWNRGSTID